MIPPAFVRRLLPEWVRARLRPVLYGINDWLLETRVSVIARLVAPLKKQDDFGKQLFRLLEAKGVHILPVHYYSPVPDTHELRSGDQSWREEADISDLQFSFDEQRRLGETFRQYRDEIAALPDADQLRVRGYGLGYGPIEAMLLHCFIRHFRPKRIIEVGSGVSTFYEANAISLNAKDGTPPCKLTCIEPFPSDLLRSIPEVSQVIPKKVQEIPLDVFRQLVAGDILFIDSSHSVKIGSDVNYLYLHVLPALRPGALIHIHDIYLPHLAPPDFWLFDQLMFWQETVLLKALLSGNTNFEVVYCTSYLHHKDPGSLTATFPAYDPRIHYPQSIWLRKLDPEAAKPT